jgi:hypothetical protein
MLFLNGKIILTKKSADQMGNFYLIRLGNVEPVCLIK